MHILYIYQGKVQRNIQVTQKMKIVKNNHMASRFAIQITIKPKNISDILQYPLDISPLVTPFYFIETFSGYFKLQTLLYVSICKQQNLVAQVILVLDV